MFYGDIWITTHYSSYPLLSGALNICKLKTEPITLHSLPWFETDIFAGELTVFFSVVGMSAM